MNRLMRGINLCQRVESVTRKMMDRYYAGFFALGEFEY